MAFNGLTDEEDEALTLVAEECAEVIKAICKIQRHGFETYNPRRRGDGTNAEQLERELGDLRAAYDVLHHNTVHIAEDSVEAARIVKLKKVRKFLHHARVPKPAERQRRAR